MKKQLTLLLMFLLLPLAAFAQVDVVAQNSGYYEVYRDSAGIEPIKISQHTTDQNHNYYA